jgi:hypothetical protein
MPEEYLNCVKSYTAKGVSEKVAKGRCAAMYYKRHGKTVKEAAGESANIDYDEELYQTILDIDKIMSSTVSDVVDKLRTEEVVGSIVDHGDNLIEIIATKDYANAFTGDGQIVQWEPNALAEMAHTWTRGLVSANHERKKTYGVIVSSWYAAPNVHQLLWVNDTMYGWIQRNPGHIGVSVEANNLILKENKIFGAGGTGVTFVFPPQTPGCTNEQGCGILGSEIEEFHADGAKLSYAEREKLSDSAFCGPDRSFPAHDAAHVRNGLARLSQSNLSAEQKAKVHGCLASRAKKYGIEVESTTPEEGENAVEETTPTEEVSVEKGEKMAESVEAAKPDFDKVKAELETAQKKVTELQEYKDQTVAKEKEAKLAVISSYVDATPYKEAHLCTLEAVASALAEYKKKLDDAPVVNSGASAIASTDEVPKPPEERIPDGFSSKEDYEIYLKAKERLKAHTGRELK